MKSLLRILPLFLILLSACTKENTASHTRKNPVEVAPIVEKRVFDYQPAKPINGQLNAVIELGALGLNYFIIKIDQNARWTLEKQNFGKSNIIYGGSKVGQIISDVQNFQKSIINYGVRAENIHLVISSSVPENQVEELVSELAKLSIKIEVVDSEKEAEYALIATIPKEFAKESFLVDVGSGSTKISWMNSRDTSTLKIPGSKYFLEDVKDTTVFRIVRNAVLEVPESNRNLCFMLGGIVYDFVKREVDNSPYRYIVLDPPGSYPTDDDRLRAGDVIYSALHLEPTYSYIFDKQSNFSIGYLVSLKQ